jgi:glycosyltransferase involved in cell wall biosynthesis
MSGDGAGRTGRGAAMVPGVIVSTYENPRALDLVLRGWARQTVAPAQMLVADDGSGPETAAVVARWGAAHVRLEHTGRFGKCRVANAAVLAARSRGVTWLLFTDGDWLPARDLLARHLEETRPHRFVSGGGIRLSRAESEALTAADVDRGTFERLGGNKPHYRLPRGLGHVLDRIQPRRAPWKGGNSSAFLDDIVRVGGYDERFGYGFEDNELGARLENAGVRGFSIRYTAPVYHLWHERPWVDEAAQAGHRAMLEETRRSGIRRTEHGIPETGMAVAGSSRTPPGPMTE